MKNEKIQVDRASREVTEGKLLASLDDGAHVAIVRSEVELTNLISALDVATRYGEKSDIYREAALDFRKLRREAFGR